ncbi:unnamed protein product, partial [Closterium sp. NIES-54]
LGPALTDSKKKQATAVRPCCPPSLVPTCYLPPSRTPSLLPPLLSLSSSLPCPLPRLPSHLSSCNHKGPHPHPLPLSSRLLFLFFNVLSC